MNPERMAMTYPAYSVAQLAQRWSCSRSDIYKKIKTGTLRPFRVGGLIRFTAAYIDQIEGECGSSCTAANGPQPEPQKAKSGDVRLERVIVLPPGAASAESRFPPVILPPPSRRRP